MSTREWLSPSGTFLFGKHRGLPIEDVAKSDPSYIRWIVNEIEDIDESDRQILETLLARRK